MPELSWPFTTRIVWTGRHEKLYMCWLTHVSMNDAAVNNTLNEKTLIVSVSV